MVKAKDDTGKEAAPPADFGRVDDAAATGASAPVNPLMSSFAAATAIGFNFASQMAGAMLGSFQGAMEATSKLARTLEEERKANAAKADAAQPAAPVADEPPAPVVSPVAAPAEKPVAAKKATAKKSAAVKTVSKAKPIAAVATDKPAAKVKPAAKAKSPATVEAKPSKAAARKTSGKASARTSGNADDLKRIPGIGPKVEQVLNGLGVSKFAQIAAWRAEDIARFDSELGFAGRIERDGWVAQAQALAGGKH